MLFLTFIDFQPLSMFGHQGKNPHLMEWLNSSLNLRWDSTLQTHIFSLSSFFHDMEWANREMERKANK